MMAISNAVSFAWSVTHRLTKIDSGLTLPVTLYVLRSFAINAAGHMPVVWYCNKNTNDNQSF